MDKHKNKSERMASFTEDNLEKHLNTLSKEELIKFAIKSKIDEQSILRSAYDHKLNEQKKLYDSNVLEIKRLYNNKLNEQKKLHESEISKLESVNKTQEVKIKELNDTIFELKKLISEKETRIKELGLQISSLENRIKELETSITLYKHDINKLKEEVNSYSLENNKLNTKVSELVSLHGNIEHLRKVQENENKILQEIKYEIKSQRMIETTFNKMNELDIKVNGINEYNKITHKLLETINNNIINIGQEVSCTNEKLNDIASKQGGLHSEKSYQILLDSLSKIENYTSKPTNIVKTSTESNLNKLINSPYTINDSLKNEFKLFRIDEKTNIDIAISMLYYEYFDSNRCSESLGKFASKINTNYLHNYEIIIYDKQLLNILKIVDFIYDGLNINPLFEAYSIKFYTCSAKDYLDFLIKNRKTPISPILTESLISNNMSNDELDKIFSFIPYRISRVSANTVGEKLDILFTSQIIKLLVQEYNIDINLFERDNIVKDTTKNMFDENIKIELSETTIQLNLFYTLMNRLKMKLLSGYYVAITLVNDEGILKIKGLPLNIEKEIFIGEIFSNYFNNIVKGPTTGDDSSVYTNNVLFTSTRLFIRCNSREETEELANKINTGSPTKSSTYKEDLIINLDVNEINDSLL